MTQGTLFEDRTLELAETPSGFDVLNNHNFDDKDCQKIAHIPNKETNDKIGITKEEFEEKVKKNYGVDKVEWNKSKFDDEEGTFVLNDVKIKYKFKAQYLGGMGHIDFNSVVNKKPNLLTETGYRSQFVNNSELEEYDKIIDYIKSYCEHCVKETKVKRGQKKPECEFEESGNKVAVTNEQNPFAVKQIDLSTTKEDVVKEQEERKKEKICVVCGKKDKEWDINERDKCKDCLRKFFEEEFDKAGLDKTGFREKDISYTFFSHTTGLQRVYKEMIYGVGYSIMGTDLFPKTIYICDEFGLQNNCLGITDDFFNHLIKELKLEKTIDGTKEEIKINGIELHTKWLNPKISKDEKGKKLAFLDKEITLKKVEMNNLLKQKVDILKGGLKKKKEK